MRISPAYVCCRAVWTILHFCRWSLPCSWRGAKMLEVWHQLPNKLLKQAQPWTLVLSVTRLDQGDQILIIKRVNLQIDSPFQSNSFSNNCLWQKCFFGHCAKSALLPSVDSGCTLQQWRCILGEYALLIRLCSHRLRVYVPAKLLMNNADFMLIDSKERSHVFREIWTTYSKANTVSQICLKYAK